MFLVMLKFGRFRCVHFFLLIIFYGLAYMSLPLAKFSRVFRISYPRTPPALSFNTPASIAVASQSPAIIYVKHPCTSIVVTSIKLLLIRPLL